MINYFQLGLITAVTVGKVILCCAAGMFISKFFLERKKSEKGLSYISVQIFLPCLLFSNLCQSVTWETVTLYYWAPVIALLPISLGFVMSFLTKNLVPERYRALLILGSCFQNGLTFPISLVVNLKGIEWFGPAQVSNAQSFLFLYNIICSIGLWAIGEPVVKYYKKKEVEEERVLAREQQMQEQSAAHGDAAEQHVNDSFAYPYESSLGKQEDDDASKDVVGEVDGNNVTSHSSSSHVGNAAYTASTHNNNNNNNNNTKSKRSANTVEQMRWYKPPGDHDAPIRTLNGDGEAENAAAAASSSNVQRWVKTVGGAFKSPPVYASLIGIGISLTPPLRWVAESFCGQILVGGFSLVGGGAIPVQLLVLGLTVMSARGAAAEPDLAHRTPEEPAATEETDANDEVIVARTTKTLADRIRQAIPPDVLFSILAVGIRLVFIPIICFLVIHLLHIGGLLPNDSSFLLTMLIETCSPSAINSSLICALHDYHADMYTKMIFMMYVVCIISTTIWLFLDILYVQSYM